MIEYIEALYEKNNMWNKKYAKVFWGIIFTAIIVMMILTIQQEIIWTCVISIIALLILFVLKNVFFLITIKDKGIGIICSKEKLDNENYNNTKKDIEDALKQYNSYNLESIKILIDYFKDTKIHKKFDLIQISNYVFAFLSAIGVLVREENIEMIDSIFKIVLYILGMISIIFIVNKFLDKISNNILECKINYKQLCKIFTEISLEIIKNNENCKKEDIKRDVEKITYIEKVPSSKEFNYLTESVGWGRRNDSIIEEALNNTLYSLCVYDGEKIIGYGRIIGDKSIFLHIHDVIVIPEYQNKGIGAEIMTRLLKQIDEYKKVNLNIRTYLGASKGKESFYEKFGFVRRPNEEFGAGMILYNKIK